MANRNFKRGGRRNQRVHVPLTDKELRELQDRVEADGSSMSTYARTAIKRQLRRDRAG